MKNKRINNRFFRYINRFTPKQLQWGVFSIICIFYLVGIFYAYVTDFRVPFIDFISESSEEIENKLGKYIFHSFSTYSYFDIGIKRRIFISTLLSIFSKKLLVHYYVYSFFAVTLTLAVFYFASKSIKKVSANQSITFLLLLFAFSKIGAGHYGVYTMSLDTFFMPLLLLVLYFLLKNKLILTSLLLSIGILIHLGFVFYALPVSVVFLMQLIDYKKIHLSYNYNFNKTLTTICLIWLVGGDYLRIILRYLFNFLPAP